MRSGQDDIVKEFDTRCDQTPKAASDIPAENGLGGSIPVKLSGFCSASDCIGHVWTRKYSKQRTTKLLQSEDVSKTSYWSDNEDAQPQSPERNSGKRSSDQESKRKKASVERKVGECYQWKAIGEYSEGDYHVVSVKIQRLETDAIKFEKGNRPLLHQKRRHRLTEKCPRQNSGRRGESTSGTRGKIPCRFFFWEKVHEPVM